MAEEFEGGQETALLPQEVALAAQPMAEEVRAVMNHLTNRIKKWGAKIQSQDARIDKLERQMDMMLQNMQKQETENVELRRVFAAQQVSIDTLAIQVNLTPGEDQIRELLNLRDGAILENRATYDGLRGQENMMLRQQLILIDQQFASQTKTINELKARIDHLEQQLNMSEAAESQQMMAVFGV
ncbi:hypothetical protein BV898_16948 [Hypsibius exemplaris]|uniref:Uncharacterized protein n=1 Tax=Hypsibius exemplaris TaxID=2072580 RepID=A0A9X6NLG1_HYPEX|nr:hypothetical protein BV898_16948 [Hypsibius exemplaris]